ncbi:MAG: hypothetical protein R2812_00860 [Gelidibacter sp.]|nr:hypothetical protein [Gelidibacter sp.]
MIPNETLIEYYFSKKLSEEEFLEFENLYNTDTKFKEKVDFLKNIQAVSEAEDDAQFKTKLATLELHILKKNSPWLKPLSAVAAILIIALGIHFFINRSIHEEKLFSSYFEPSKNVSVPIVRSETNENLLNNAFIAYSETNYDKAFPLFEKAFENTKNSELLFYEGNALLASGKTERAIEKFKQHLTYSDVLTNRSHWYLALAYLKKNDLKSAKHTLKVYLNTGDPFKREEAKSLLKQLD